MYDYLLYKTFQEIYDMLPIDGHTALFTSCTGIYYPDRDKKKYGTRLATTVASFTEKYLYVD